MDRTQESTLNRAIGYCQALYYYQQFETIAECKDEALSAFGIDNELQHVIFHNIINELIPSSDA
jgi:hypothetical protein